MASLKKQRELYERIKRHGETLQAIFPAAAGIDPVELCKKLMRIETKTRQAAELYCNGDITPEEWETAQDKAFANLEKLLATVAVDVPVIINGDPRGCALKIDDAWMKAWNDGRGDLPRLITDWGGYGLLAPDLRED